jgi:hypothetical protein
MVIFHSYVYVYQRVYPENISQKMVVTAIKLLFLCFVIYCYGYSFYDPYEKTSTTPSYYIFRLYVGNVPTEKLAGCFQDMSYFPTYASDDSHVTCLVILKWAKKTRPDIQKNAHRQCFFMLFLGAAELDYNENFHAIYGTNHPPLGSEFSSQHLRGNISYPSAPPVAKRYVDATQLDRT